MLRDLALFFLGIVVPVMLDAAARFRIIRRPVAVRAVVAVLTLIAAVCWIALLLPGLGRESGGLNRGVVAGIAGTVLGCAVPLRALWQLLPRSRNGGRGFPVVQRNHGKKASDVGP